MNRYKYFICSRDLIEVAHGNMDKVTWYPRKPKVCDDAYCDIDSFLEVIIEISDPKKDAKNKVQGTKQPVAGNRKKR